MTRSNISPAFSSHASALPDGVAPEWVQLLPAGAFSGRDGRGPYRSDAAAIDAAFERHGMPLAIDYEHQSINAADNGQPAPAAGWITALEFRDGALWGRVEWTPRAAEFIAAREYRYLSPVFQYAPQSGAVLAMLGAGLTNQPNLHLAALHRLGFPAGVPPVSSTGAISMDDIDTLMALPAVAQMRSALGLPDTTGLSDLLAAAQARLSQPPAEPDPALYVPIAAHTALSAELESLRGQVKTAEVAAAVEAAERDGKLVPALRDWATAYCRSDAAGFAAWAQAAPVVAPAGNIATPERAAKTEMSRAEFDALDPASRAAAMRTGVQLI